MWPQRQRLEGCTHSQGRPVIKRLEEEGTDSPIVPLREGGPIHVLSGAQ